MRRTTCCLSLLFVMAVTGAAFAAPPPQSLIDALQGEPSARVEAAQLLPRYGVAPVPLLLPLLEHANPTVAKAADNVLWAIANQAARPGRERDAAEATRLLMEALKGAGSEAIRSKLLRLLSVVVPEGADVAPLAALLGDADSREAARTTIERIGTEQARAALRDALTDNDAEFTVALLNSLGRLRDEATLPIARRMVQDENPAIRAAAARALAWTGDPELAERLGEVARNATPATKPDAIDALLRFADATARRDDGRPAAVKVYLGILEAADSEVLRAAALVGLGQHGDAAVVGPILTAAGAGGTTQATAMLALESLSGPDVDQAILQAFGRQPQQLRPAMVAAMGRRGGSVLLPALIEAARDDEPALRLAGLRALGDAGEYGGLAALVEAAGAGAEAERTAAVDSTARLAGTLRAAAAPEEAGQAYVALFRMANTPEFRRQALEGLVACPVAEAFEVLRDAGQDPALVDLASPALAASVGVLASAGRLDDARRALDLLVQLPLTGEAAGMLVARLAPYTDQLQVPRRLGFISDWWLVGPFPFGGPGTGLGDVNVGEPNINLEATYEVDGRQLKWQHLEGSAAATTINLIQAVGEAGKVVCYAYSRVTVPEGMDAALRMGSDDGIRVWVNGELVHDHDVDRGAAIDQDTAAVKLRAGENDLLVKVSQGGGGWAFCLRVTTPDGRAVPVTVAGQ